jgi:hypothetical protein
VHNISDVMQIEIYAAESSHLEGEIAIINLKKCKLSGNNHILAEHIQT